MITLLKLTPFADAALAPSPNFDTRTSATIEGIVLHASADQGNENAALAWLQSPASKVSCHLLVNRDGGTRRLVGDLQRAWHAGLSWWRGKSDVNSITIGIEIANRNDGEPFTDAQYQRVAEIVAHYCRQGLAVEDVVAHADVASERRTDPVGWDWKRFREMVHDLLNPTDFDVQWAAYDRRSAERLAVDAFGRKDHGPPPASAQIVPPMECKGPMCSRTIWVNGLTVLAAGRVLVGDALDLAFSVGLTLPKEITMWALFGVGMVNILLRLETSLPIGARK